MKANRLSVHPMIVKYMTKNMPFCDAYALQKMNTGEFHDHWISPIGVMTGLMMVAFACYKPIFPVVWMACVFAPVLLWSSVKLMFQHNRLYALWDSLTDSVQRMEQVFKLGDTSLEPDGKVVGHIRETLITSVRIHLNLEDVLDLLERLIKKQEDLHVEDCLIETNRINLRTDKVWLVTSGKCLGDFLDIAKACWGNRIDDGHGLEKFFRLARERKASAP